MTSLLLSIMLSATGAGNCSNGQCSVPRKSVEKSVEKNVCHHGKHKHKKFRLFKKKCR